MVCTENAVVLILCCGVVFLAIFSISPCSNIEVLVLQIVLQYEWWNHGCVWSASCLAAFITILEWAGANIWNVNSRVVKYILTPYKTLKTDFWNHDVCFTDFPSKLKYSTHRLFLLAQVKFCNPLLSVQWIGLSKTLCIYELSIFYRQPFLMPR